MGQAKQRGTFEQRRAAAVARSQKKLDDLIRTAQELEDRMTPIERARVHRAKAKLAAAAGLTIFGKEA